MIIGCASPDPVTLCFPGSSNSIELVKTHKHLGVRIDSALSWSEQVNVCRRTSSAFGALTSHCSHLPHSCKILFYRCYILPLFDYADTAWCGLNSTLSTKLETHHKKIIKRLFGLPQLFSSAQLYSRTASSPLCERRQAHLCTLAHIIYLKRIPQHLEKYDWFQRDRPTRNQVSLPAPRLSLFLNSPVFMAYRFWLSLSYSIRRAKTLSAFNKALRN